MDFQIKKWLRHFFIWYKTQRDFGLSARCADKLKSLWVAVFVKIIAVTRQKTKIKGRRGVPPLNC
ncbi:MAG: hypothetical protein AUK48_02965 [Oscillatoriales cyanobacterium CG2_30_44_21]|nr:MAG: hypothetical protein AUK48_02965 [Oscillatoriales cyanobacterium CG2_30_44_21]